jgi:GDPmannose 4,6-dehydratase
MWHMLQQSIPGDYIVATGVGATVRDFCRVSFDEAGLNWEKYVELDETYLRPTEVDALIGDARKTKETLNWEPEMKWEELARLMTRSDMSL